jgi:hypothetical protein
MEDVPRIVTAECRARAYLTPTKDHTGPIRTGRRATTLPGNIPRAVAATSYGEWMRRKRARERAARRSTLRTPSAQSGEAAGEGDREIVLAAIGQPMAKADHHRITKSTKTLRLESLPDTAR